MFQYVNGFSYAVNSNKNEVMLSLRQTYPVLDLEGKVSEVTNTPIADIVLTREGVLSLRQILNEINLDEET